MTSILLVGTILGAGASPALAQDAPAAPAQEAPAQATPAITAAPVQQGTIRSIRIVGSERLESETVRSYANLYPGQEYSAETLDQALKDLYATQLFADAVITGGETGNIVITVRENPVINRIVLEGNKKIKNDKILPEIKLAPRQIFTRTGARSDVDRIIELYRRQGRFAATVEPKIVQLDQNRVDVVFEISEGDKSKVRAINIIGNEEFSDGRLRKEMYTKEAGGVLGIFKSNDSYDADRLAADQQKLRAFYLTQGYADFRVVSALAELTPDRKDFVITYVVEEGDRYKFGTVDAESELRDFTAETIKSSLRIKPGDWFNAKLVEDSVTALNEVAGAKGYAFADVQPDFQRDAEKKVMDLTLRVLDTPRVYVEQVNITGNTHTRDKVIRREMRVHEGDAFNAVKIKRSQDRIKSLGYFQETLEIKQAKGSSPETVNLNIDVEEKPTGQLSVSAGYSSLERFVIQTSIEENNWMGKGQQLSAGINWSRYSKGIQLGFSEPYLFDKQILLGGSLFARDLNSFQYVGNTRNTTYKQRQLGGTIKLGFPLTEYMSFGTRYSLVHDNISLDKGLFYTDPDLGVDPDGTGPLPAPNGPLEPVCDPNKAGRYLCDEIGKRLTSSIGYTVAFDNTNGVRATRGQRIVFNQDFAGLGGNTRYLRQSLDATKYMRLPADFVLSVHGEGGFIKALQKAPGEFRDAIRLNDRFFGPQLRGFDIRGIGPRVVRIPYNADGTPGEFDANTMQSDSIGGKAYYMGRLELEFPSSAGMRSMGIRPSAYVDVGSLFSMTSPKLDNFVYYCTPTVNAPANSLPIKVGGDYAGTTCPQNTADPTKPFYNSSPGFQELFLGNSPKPRLSVGIGVNWVSPFGPLRIDVAKAVMKQKGDDTKLFSFNVGTQF